MAKEKSSFVLYSDLIHLVDQLPDETAGQLLKTILDYVNDKNPEPKDLTLRIAFEPIKRQLKRDLKKYEKTKVRKSAAGKKGMASRWSKPITEHNTVITAITNDNTVIPPITAITDNVNVNVTDTVNENVIKTKSFALTFPHGSEEFLKLWGDWVEHRTALKKPYQTFSAQQIELQALGEYPEPVAIQMLKNAVKNGWRNLRPLDLLPTTTTAATPGPQKRGA